MYNPFSYITILIKKWTDGTKFDFVKMVSSFVLFFCCILLLLKWNTVPCYKDSVYFETYRGHNIQNDSLGININITRPYNTFSSLKEYKAGYKIGIVGYFECDSIGIPSNNKKSDSLINELDGKVKGVCKDSTILLIHSNVKMDVAYTKARDKGEDINTFSKNGSACIIKNWVESKDTTWACTDVTAAFKVGKYDENNGIYKPLFLHPNFISNDITINSGMFRSWFRWEDISQCYYSLDIKSNRFDNQVNFIKIDFGGAVDFSEIYPEPDRISYSSIMYNDAKKIEYIRAKGLTFYCQLLESVGLQNVRIFLLTAFASFFLGVSLKLLLEILWRFFKRKINK